MSVDLEAIYQHLMIHDGVDGITALALHNEVEQLRHDNAAYLRLIERLEGDVIEQVRLVEQMAPLLADPWGGYGGEICRFCKGPLLVQSYQHTDSCVFLVAESAYVAWKEQHNAQ